MRLVRQISVQTGDEAMAENQPLHIFADVNVYLDAIIPWNIANSGTPVTLQTPTKRLQGTPRALILVAVGEGVEIHGQRLVLHTSDSVLSQVAGKLQEQYRWSAAASDLALKWIHDLVELSRGSVVKQDKESIPKLQPISGNNRISEVLATQARVLVTSNRTLIAGGQIRGVVPMSPWHFVTQSRLQ